jgi:glycerol uptake facilitator-like aquaporin
MTGEDGRKLLAEALGTAFLLAAVIGSGIMAERLAGGNDALALLCNTIPTGAILVVIILVFGPISGAHFNPAVTVALAARRDFPWAKVPSYILVQIAGGLAGAWAAHFMFDLPVLQASTHLRSGAGLWFAEAVATFGLVMTIVGCVAKTPAAVPYAVGLYITSAYWFTASTSFANPAVTIARAFTDTFSGITPAHAPAFILAQFIGVAACLVVLRVLFPKKIADAESRAVAA